MSFDTGEGLTEKISPFDTYAQIIEGKAEMIIDKESHLLKSGDGIIIPAFLPNYIVPDGRFKMILTIVKTGGINFAVPFIKKYKEVPIIKNNLYDNTN